MHIPEKLIPYYLLVSDFCIDIITINILKNACIMQIKAETEKRSLPLSNMKRLL